MKHLKTYEENIIKSEPLPSNIKLVDVLWNGFYTNFNGGLSQLGVGDHTNKGTIISRRDFRSDLYFTTENGEFRANLFKVYTSDNYWNLQDFIKMKKDLNKYNI
jgi:hypothetical protein